MGKSVLPTSTKGRDNVLTGIGGIDSIGAAGIAWLSLREGREAFLKAAGKACGCQAACD